jgi:signal transduction histidine kinase/CheY-like chemotaxis protein
LIKSIIKKLEDRYCNNTNRGELNQAYFRIILFVVCSGYSLFLHNTLYMWSVTSFACFATFFWIFAAWRTLGRERTRHVWTMIYDCSIIGLVMIGLGSAFMGLFGVLLWISIAYGLRYRKPFYFKLGIVLTSLTFIISAIVTRWDDWGIFSALLVTLIVVPLVQLVPLTKMIHLIEKLDKANKDLDEANKFTTKFVSNVTHDLITPVNAIIGYSELTPPDVDGIRVNAAQLIRQIRAILGKTIPVELTANKYLEDEYLEEFSAAELLGRTASMVRPQATNRNIIISINALSDGGVYFGAADAISTCLSNLTVNALKHSDCNTIVLGAFYSDDRLYFEVSDNGKGISILHRDHIFNRFFRMPHSESEGLGLGLTIVKDTIDRNQGEITLESSESGTNFKFFMPVTPLGKSTTKGTFSQRTLPSSGHASKRNILFVDDDFSGRKAWSSFLRTSGQYVHMASSGKEALASIESGNQYSIYILDYKMPEMNGLELASRIREIDAHAKILIISADVNSDPNKKFKNSVDRGVINLALGKPINPEKLLAVVEELQNPKPSSVRNDDLTNIAKIEIREAIIDIDKALRNNDHDCAQMIAHKARATVSFLNDDSVIDAIKKAHSPSEVLKVLRATNQSFSS